MRQSTPKEIETDVLMRSARRCCLCFGIDSDFETKRGQIAHIDRDPQNSDLDNLVYLCLRHHDEYDSRTSQSKGFTAHELKAYRQRLYEKVAVFLSPLETAREALRKFELEEDIVVSAVDKMTADPEGEETSLACLDRLHRLVDASNAYSKSSDQFPEELPEEDLWDLSHQTRVRILIEHSLPHGVWGVDGEEIEEDWFLEIEPLIDSWARGRLTREGCSRVLWELDEIYDLDYFYILYGVPCGVLNKLGKRYLGSLIFEFGERYQSAEPGATDNPDDAQRI